MPQGRLQVTKPVAVWNKPLKAGFRSLFKGLSKMAAHGYAADWTKAGIDAADALAAVGLEKDPGQAAYVLIRRALTRALFDLAAEKADRFYPGEHDYDCLCDELDLSLEDTELTIDAGFFDRPRDLPIVDALHAPFEH